MGILSTSYSNTDGGVMSLKLRCTGVITQLDISGVGCTCQLLHAYGEKGLAKICCCTHVTSICRRKLKKSVADHL